jgi:hypothetical protein
MLGSIMHGVTTALVGFLLVCVIYPNLVKNKTQYYAAFAAVCLVILFDALGFMISGAEKVAGFRVFAYVACAFLQVVAIVMLFLGCGGISWRELADEMKDAVEVVRRGGDEKEIIVPLSGEMARLRSERQAERRAERSSDDTERERYVINDPTPPASGLPPQNPPKSQEPGRIPLEP